MSFYGSEEHDPVTWVRGYPVYAAHLVVAVFIASMLATTLLMLSQSDAVANWMIFGSEAVLRGEVWRILSYGFWNPPNLWFAIKMLMLVWFGREVEKAVGRGKFLALYGCLYVLTPLVLTLLGPWFASMLAGESGAFAVFIAFAALYPNVPMFFSVLAKWVAAILVGIYTLMALASRNWDQLIALWASTGFAIGFIRYHQGHLTLPKFRLPRTRRKPQLRVLPDLPKREVTPDSGPSTMAEVDALLDKIAQSGIGSLTPKERAKLDAARRDLKRRSGA